MTRTGPTIDELVVADDSERWAKLGFTISDGCCQLGEVMIRFSADPEAQGIVGWSLRDIVGNELDGLPTTISRRPPRLGGPVQPNGIVAIDHLVAVSPSLDRSVQALRQAGLDLHSAPDF